MHAKKRIFKIDREWKQKEEKRKKRKRKERKREKSIYKMKKTEEIKWKMKKMEMSKGMGKETNNILCVCCMCAWENI